MAQGGFLAYNEFKTVVMLESVMRKQNDDNDPLQAHIV